MSAELDRDKAIIEKVPGSEATLEWFQLSRDVVRVARDLEPAAVGGAVACDARM